MFFLHRFLCCNHVTKHFRNKTCLFYCYNAYTVGIYCYMPTVTRCSRALCKWSRPEIDRFNSDDVDIEPRRNSRADPQPPLNSFCWEVKGTTRETCEVLFLDFNGIPGSTVVCAARGSRVDVWRHAARCQLNILGRERRARDHAAVNGTRSVRCRVETLLHWTLISPNRNLSLSSSALSAEACPHGKCPHTACSSWE